MANTFKWVLQSISNNQYLTSTGWSANIADAKSFDQPADLDGLNNGDYILIPIWSIT